MKITDLNGEKMTRRCTATLDLPTRKGSKLLWRTTRTMNVQEGQLHRQLRAKAAKMRWRLTLRRIVRTVRCQEA
jgi:hypothetical protein